METNSERDFAAEIELMRKIGQGDRRSFDELYDLYSRILLSTAFHVLNNQEAAEDVLQDAFIMIWEKAPLYDPSRGKPLTWALTMTRNKAIDRLRSMQRRHRLQDDLQRESDVFEHFDERNALDAVTSVETNAMLRAALEKLPQDQREAIKLAFFESLTQSEIAARLNEPVGTIKARIRRGLTKMRESLQRKI
jgi:RNA polymerase sigma-70 factor (ECF subfamily)